MNELESLPVKHSTGLQWDEKLKNASRDAASSSEGKRIKSSPLLNFHNFSFTFPFFYYRRRERCGCGNEFYCWWKKNTQSVPFFCLASLSLFWIEWAELQPEQRYFPLSGDGGHSNKKKIASSIHSHSKMLIEFVFLFRHTSSFDFKHTPAISTLGLCLWQLLQLLSMFTLPSRFCLFCWEKKHFELFSYET